jgi:serine/threonine-protein kinase
VQKAGLTPKIVDRASATVQKGLVITTSPANGNLVARGTTVTLFVSNGPPKVKVPNVLHQPEPDARNLLVNEGFKVNEVTAQNSTAKPNTVVGQNPAGGTLVNKGATVTLSVSPGGSQVPNVVGQQVAVAQGQLANAGFTNVQVNEVSSPGVPDGTVTQQSPTAGQVVPTSTAIVLDVVKNQPTPTPTPTTPSPTPTSTSTSGTVPPSPGGRHS